MSLLNSVSEQNSGKNGSSVLSLGLDETPEVPNTILVDNSLSFLMLH
jgi:hypothetical protein